MDEVLSSTKPARPLSSLFRNNYVDPSLLSINSQEAFNATAYFQTFEKEAAKAYGFASSRLQSVDSAISRLSEKVKRLRGLDNPSDLNSSQLDAAEIVDELLNTDLFVRENQNILRSIISDGQISQDGASLLESKLSALDWTMLDKSMRIMLVKLGKIFEVINERKGATQKESVNGEAKVSQSSFTRNTIKYWVHPSNIMAVKSYIAQHLPVLIFNEDEKTKAQEAENARLKQSGTISVGPDDHEEITSVYLDDEQYSCYHTRLQKREGATLIRVRWYGELTDSTDVFVEKKTHHESWVVEKSTKERFPVKPKNVRTYLGADPAIVPKIERKLSKMFQQEQLNEKEYKTSLDLASSIFTEIRDRKLSPVLVTRYDRTAFQLKQNNDVRISLDTNLTLIPIRDRSFPSNEDLSSKFERFVFPYAVLEIKLRKEAPEWIEQLKSTNLIIQREKFSKFCHGCAFWYPEQVKEYPYWMTPEEIQQNVHREKSRLHHPNRRVLSLSNHSPSFAQILEETSTDPEDVILQDSGNDCSDKSDGSSPKVPQKALHFSQDLDCSKPPLGSYPPTPVTPASPGNTLSYSPAASTRIPQSQSRRNTWTNFEFLSPQQLDTEALTFIDIGEDLQSHSSSAPYMQTKPIPRPDSQLGGELIKNSLLLQRGGKGKSTEQKKSEAAELKEMSTISKKVRSRNPVKIEPKTFFANERTFIQWVGAAVLIFTMGSALFGMENESGGNATRIIGTMLIPLSLFLLIYAFAIYWTRITRIKNRRDGPYDDRRGPTILTVILVVVIIVTICVLWIDYRAQQSKIKKANKVRVRDPGITEVASDSCVSFNLSSLSPFYQPSGLAYDAVHDYMYTCGVYTFSRTSLGKFLNNSGSFTSFSLPNQDIEAVTIVDPTSSIVYLGVENPENAIIEYDTASQQILRKISLASHIGQNAVLEALEFIPDNTSTTGGLFFLNTDAKLLGLRIDLAQSKPEVEAVMEIVVSGNAEIQKNLSKIGDVTYHGDFVFVLLDQLRVLRIFSLTNGTQIGEYVLPGDSQQWEGITVMAHPLSVDPDFLEIYLAKDTPREIWRFDFNLVTGFQSCSPDSSTSSLSNNQIFAISISIGGFFLLLALLLILFAYRRHQAQRSLKEEGEYSVSSSRGQTYRLSSIFVDENKV